MDRVEATRKKGILEAIVLLCRNNAIAKDKNLFAVKRMERRKEKRQDKRSNGVEEETIEESTTLKRFSIH